MSILTNQKLDNYTILLLKDISKPDYQHKNHCRVGLALAKLRLHGLIIIRTHKETITISGRKGPGWDLTKKGQELLKKLNNR